MSCITIRLIEEFLMSLVKKEIICVSCETQYIVVMNEDDADKLTCCPFCTIVHDVSELDEDQ